MIRLRCERALLICRGLGFDSSGNFPVITRCEHVSKIKERVDVLIIRRLRPEFRLDTRLCVRLCPSNVFIETFRLCSMSLFFPLDFRTDTFVTAPIFSAVFSTLMLLIRVLSLSVWSRDLVRWNVFGFVSWRYCSSILVFDNCTRETLAYWRSLHTCACV